MEKAIQKTDTHSLVVGGVESLASFFMPGEISRAFHNHKWHVDEMVDTLVAIIRDDALVATKKKDGTTVMVPAVSPREKMAAISMLAQKAKEGLILGGMIQQARGARDYDLPCPSWKKPRRTQGWLSTSLSFPTT